MPTYHYLRQHTGKRFRLRGLWFGLVRPRGLRPDGQNYTGRLATVVWGGSSCLPLGAQGRSKIVW